MTYWQGEFSDNESFKRWLTDSVFAQTYDAATVVSAEEQRHA